MDLTTTDVEGENMMPISQEDMSYHRSKSQSSISRSKRSLDMNKVEWATVSDKRSQSQITGTTDSGKSINQVEESVFTVLNTFRLVHLLHLHTHSLS